MMKKKLLYLFILISIISYSQIPSYYNDVNLNLSGQALKDELAVKVISTHTTNLSYTPGIWDALKQTDLDPNDPNKVLLIYGWDDTDEDVTNDLTRSKDMNGGNLGDWNREHVYAKSLGTPDLGTSGPGSDAHHLRSSDVQWNSIRSNRKFASGSGNSGVTALGYWYPGDDWKGDVARMMMYMYIRYGTQCLPINVGVGNSIAGDANMIDLFLQWNADDPVSQVEIQRNPIVEGLQGNRNPFIDNPAFATEIWGGPQAEDLFGGGITDTEAPSTPTSLAASSITSFSADLTWIASTDNIGVTGYNVYKDGIFLATSSTNSYNAVSLSSNTTYTFYVEAKDAAGNISTASNTVNITTTTTPPDTEAPSAPFNLAASNITFDAANLSWTASTDNIGVTGYNVYQNGLLLASTATASYSATNLSPETTYAFYVQATDAAGNVSAASNTINITTTSASGGGNATDLFLSEYIEGSSLNKAIEIANFTGVSVNLSAYSIKKQTNGAGSWSTGVNLSGTLDNADVYVIANTGANSTILSVADISPAVTELDFNGNDALGLFKNGVLIDIIGTFDGGTANFAQNVTLVRKATVSSPVTTYDVTEWDSFVSDTSTDLGTHTFNAGSTSDTEAPSTPTGLVASNIAFDTANLSWTASTDNIGVTGYNVYQDGLLLTSTTTTSYSVTDLSPETTYAFYIEATDAAGNVSGASNTVNVTTTAVPDTEAPSTPTGLVASNITFDTANLSWTASTDNIGVTGYNVYQDGLLLTSTTTTSYSVTDLSPETTYAFYIEATDAAGNVSAASNTINITTTSASNGTITVLHEGFFESGFDGWMDGGSDCNYYTGIRSFEGNSSIELRDNSGGASSMTLQNVDVSPYNTVEVEFYFYSNSMENNEDFWLRYHDGTSWSTIATFTSGTDFSNNNFYTAIITLDSMSSNFVSNAQFRFQCDASANNDQIYIDQVSIRGIISGGVTSKNAIALKKGKTIEYIRSLNDNELISQETFVIKSNTSTDEIQIQYYGNGSPNFYIYDLLGQHVKSGKLKNTNNIDISNLKKGIHILKLSDEEESITKKFVKK